MLQSAQICHMMITHFNTVQFTHILYLFKDGNFPVACIFAVGYSVAFILFSAGIVIVSI